LSLRFYRLPILGRCGIEANECSVKRLLLGTEVSGEEWGEEFPIMMEAFGQLLEYIDGSRRSFTLPLEPDGTPFQIKVWNELCEVPWGESCTYGEIARKIKSVYSARAVGNAVGANPIPIFIPCHRVLGAGNALGGFRLGPELKMKLLQLERISYHDRKIEKI